MAANPAALGFIEKPSFGLNLGAGMVRGRYTDRNGDSSSLRESGLMPDGALAFPLGGGVTVGIGAAYDSGLRADWRYRDLPGGLDGGTSYGTRQHLSEIVVGRIGASIAWLPVPQLSLGAGVNAVWNRNRLSGPYIFQSQPALRTAKTLLDLETEGWGVGGNLGVLWQVNEKLRLGVAYRSETRVETHGRAHANAGLQFRRVGLGAAKPTADYDAEVTNVFPQSVEFGMEWKATDRLTVTAAVEWADYSRAFDTLVVSLSDGNNNDLNGLVGGNRLQDNIPLRWRDTWSAKVGAEYALTDEWTLRAGYAWSQSPVPENTLTPLTAVIPEHAISAGVGWKRGDWTVDLGWQWQLPRSVEVDESILASGEYQGGETEVEIHWIGLSAERRF